MEKILPKTLVDALCILHLEEMSFFFSRERIESPMYNILYTTSALFDITVFVTFSHDLQQGTANSSRNEVWSSILCHFFRLSGNFDYSSSLFDDSFQKLVGMIITQHIDFKWPIERDNENAQTSIGKTIFYHCCSYFETYYIWSSVRIKVGK